MNIELKAPTSWKDLTNTDFLRVLEVGLMHLTREERLVVLLCHFTGIRHKKGDDYITADGVQFKMELWQVADFCERLAWMVDEKPDAVPNPTKCDDYLRDMSFGDWFESDTQMRLYADDGDPKHLDIVLPKLGEAVRPLTESEALMLLMWWNSVMAIIGGLYPNVFETSGTSNEKAPYNPFKLLQDFHLMLNDDHPQDNEKIDNARLHDVLSAMDSKIEKLKLREAEYNKIIHQ